MMRATLPLVAMLCTLAGRVGAEERSEEQREQREQREVPAYQGVVPVQRDEPAMAVPRGEPARLTWPGFQALPGGRARVFLQLTVLPSYETYVHDGLYVVELPGVTVHTRNNRLPVDTRHFGTAVRGFRVQAGRGSLRVVIDADPEGKPKILRERSGAYEYLYIDFPPPRPATGPTQVQDEEVPR